MKSDRQVVVTHVVHSLNPGGAERLVHDMSAALARQGYRVAVLCIDEVGEWAQQLRSKGVPVYHLGRQTGLDLYLAFRMARFFRRLGVEVIHAHQTAPWFYAALSRLFYSKPRLLFEEHGRFFPEPDRPVRRLVNRALIAPLTHVSVAVSADIKHRLVRYEGLSEQAVRVIYNGAEAEPAPADEWIVQTRNALGFSEDDHVVGFVGRLDPIKNLGLLVQSLHRLKNRIPPVRALIVGEGQELTRLRNEVNSLGLADRFVFAGYRADAHRVVHCMDSFVLPSLSEGTSMALLEAMSAGVPTIVTRVGGNPELVLDRVTGYVVSSGSVDELSQAISSVVADPDTAKKMAAAAMVRFEEKFSFDAMLATYVSIYRDLARLHVARNREAVS